MTQEHRDSLMTSQCIIFFGSVFNIKTIEIIVQMKTDMITLCDFNLSIVPLTHFYVHLKITGNAPYLIVIFFVASLLFSKPL